MKRKILYTVMVAVSILLTACGSNSKKDPIPPPPPPPGGYVFENFTSELNIDEYKTYPIRFQLTKNGLVVPDAIVSMKVPDKSIGSINTYTVTTDANGKGAFTYTPPAVFPDKREKLYVVFTDGNITLQKAVTLTFDLNTDIPTDGRATTLSITYLTSECDASRGIIGHYAIHAVDRFSRVPVVDIPVRVSLVNGITLINNEKVQKGKGRIFYENPSEVTSTIDFADGSTDFSQAGVKEGDNLIIFPSEGRTDASYIGGWDIKSVSDILTLGEQYTNLVQDNRLTYMIGNEKRLLGGENGAAGRLATAHVEPNYTTDNNGYVYFDIVFDPILAGHTVTVEAHGNEDGRRIGVAMKTGLRLEGDSFTAPDTEVPNAGGLVKTRIPITINPTCVGNQPLIDVPLSPGSFHAEPGKNCQIDYGESDFHTDSYGAVVIAVNTDGNTTATENCTIKWNGGPSSLLYEY